MSTAPLSAAEKFRLLLDRDPRYHAEGYNFVYDALDHTLKNVVNPRSRSNPHVTGQELLEGARRLAIAQFGCLARVVLESWGICKTDDIGEIVFNLVEYDLMGKQDSDKRSDFQNIYSFEEAFDVKPVLSYRSDRDEWTASYIAAK
jgi:uncharacterized repeat protein (TIGR04138 family)